MLEEVWSDISLFIIRGIRNKNRGSRNRLRAPARVYVLSVESIVVIVIVIFAAEIQPFKEIFKD